MSPAKWVLDEIQVGAMQHAFSFQGDPSVYPVFVPFRLWVRTRLENAELLRISLKAHRLHDDINIL
jgi:hypothetical protein